MTGKYELHISKTLPSTLAGWKNSLIEDKDPKDGGHYLTAYASTEAEAREKLTAAIEALRKDDGRIVRAKIELIILDIRFVEEKERA